jgi:hypothetical protein
MGLASRYSGVHLLAILLDDGLAMNSLGQWGLLFGERFIAQSVESAAVRDIRGTSRAYLETD